MDVINAFMNSDLDEDIYMEVPDGLKHSSGPNLVFKLRLALYGPKQAPRLWYSKINTFLVTEMDFTCCPYEPCLYYIHKNNTITFLILYVDDLLISSSNR